jgi:hypothetical protein
MNKENDFGDGDVDLFFIENEEGRGDSSLPSAPYFAFQQVLRKNSGLARESAGNNIKEGVPVAAAPTHGAAGSASTQKERIHFSQITTCGSVCNGRERTKWIYNPSQEWSYVNSRLMENNFHVRFREHFFR